jgi:hypothetical protein
MSSGGLLDGWLHEEWSCMGVVLRPDKNGRRILSLYLKVKYNIRRRDAPGSPGGVLDPDFASTTTDAR